MGNMGGHAPWPNIDLYFLRQGMLVGSTSIEAEDDSEAVRIAREQGDGHLIEVGTTIAASRRLCRRRGPEAQPEVRLTTQFCGGRTAGQPPARRASGQVAVPPERDVDRRPGEQAGRIEDRQRRSSGVISSGISVQTRATASQPRAASRAMIST